MKRCELGLVFLSPEDDYIIMKRQACSERFGIRYETDISSYNLEQRVPIILFDGFE